MDLTDALAADRARRGDQNAFRVLVERHSRPVFKLAFRMTSNEQDAEDLVQETFLRAWRQIHRFDQRAAFGTWLYRIAANCSLDLIRQRKVRRERQPPVDHAKAQHWLNNVASREPSPEHLTHGGEIAALLPPALNQLTVTERAAFVLRHYEGCSIEEIARSLGVGQSAAKHSIFRAVQKLRQALQPLWEATR
jgi:RNA polymerase sigma-70 factor, ECF subfamily